MENEIIFNDPGCAEWPYYFRKLELICLNVVGKFNNRLEKIGEEIAHVLRDELKKEGMLNKNVAFFTHDAVIEESKLSLGIGYAFAGYEEPDKKLEETKGD